VIRFTVVVCVFPQAAARHVNEQLHRFRRQALHAARLELVHPLTGEAMSWQASLPADMQQLLDVLSTDATQ